MYHATYQTKAGQQISQEVDEVGGRWLDFLIGSFVGTLVAGILFTLLGIVTFRPLVQWLLGRFMKRLMSDRYPENIFEMVSALTKVSPRYVLENSLRATTGQAIERPFGSPRKFLNFDGLIFLRPSWRCCLLMKMPRST